MTADLFSLRISTSGQPATHVDLRALPTVRECTHRNKGFVAITDDVDGLVAAVRELAPTARVHCSRSRGRVAVWCPADLLAEQAELDAVWQRMAKRNVTHQRMQLAMINEPTYRESVYRAW